MQRKQLAEGVRENSLGALLVQMGLISVEQLEHAVALQQKLPEDELLGRLMVSESVLTSDQLVNVLDIQKGLRSKSKYHQAMAQARLAEYADAQVTITALRLRRKVSPMDTRTLTPIATITDRG
jgi:hypothetical protein